MRDHFFHMARFVYFCRREMFVVDFKIPYFRFLLCVDIMRGSYLVLCYLQPPLVKVQHFLNPRTFEIQIRNGYKYLGSDVRKSILTYWRWTSDFSKSASKDADCLVVRKTSAVLGVRL